MNLVPCPKSIYPLVLLALTEKYSVSTSNSVRGFFPLDVNRVEKLEVVGKGVIFTVFKPSFLHLRPFFCIGFPNILRDEALFHVPCREDNRFIPINADFEDFSRKMAHFAFGHGNFDVC